jgi:heat shock protein HslJ
VNWILSGFHAPSGRVITAVPGAPATLSFGRGDNLTGTTGCNSFSGTYVASDNVITINLGPITTAACADPDAQAQEKAIIDALPKAARYSAEGGRLVLADHNKTPLLTYGSGATDIAGTAWSVRAVNNGRGGVATTALTEHLTAKFGEDGTFTAFGGCNTLSGSYTKSGGSGLKIGPLASTMKSCGAEVDDLEQVYATALDAVASYGISGETLTLSDANGTTQVTAVASH